MTVCQFFLQGRCRYGQNCRFEHTYATDGRNERSLVNSSQLQDVFKVIADQVVLAEKGGQWPLSCFSPIKEGSNVPGWKDISPEEVRWKMYEARAKGTLTQCDVMEGLHKMNEKLDDEFGLTTANIVSFKEYFEINEISQLYSDAEKNRNLLKQPTPEGAKIIVNILTAKKESGNAANPFGASSSTNIFGGGQSTPQRNVFGAAATTPTGSHGSIFGASPPTQGNIFGGAPTTQNTAFGGGTTFPKQNVFGGSTPSFNQPVFGAPPQTNQNIFSGSTSGNIFTSTQSNFSFAQPVQSQSAFQSGGFAKTPTTPIFGQSNFAQPATPTQGNIFGGGANENVFKNQNTGGSEGFTSGGNIFGGQQQTQPNTGNVFKSQQSSGNIFGGQQPSSQSRPNAMDSSVYSKVEDLSEEDVKSFKAATFSFGKIPMKPPPQEFCL